MRRRPCPSMSTHVHPSPSMSIHVHPRQSISLHVRPFSDCISDWSRATPVHEFELNERVKKNIQEGRGIRFGRGATRGGDFDFASSNPLWRASIEIFDFVPLTNASYSGGIIITDWFSAEKKDADSKRELKITVKFLTNEIRADAVDVMIFEKICKK